MHITTKVVLDGKPMVLARDGARVHVCKPARFLFVEDIYVCHSSVCMARKLLQVFKVWSDELIDQNIWVDR